MLEDLSYSFDLYLTTNTENDAEIESKIELKCRWDSVYYRKRAKGEGIQDQVQPDQLLAPRIRTVCNK